MRDWKSCCSGEGHQYNQNRQSRKKALFTGISAMALEMSMVPCSVESPVKLVQCLYVTPSPCEFFTGARN